MSTVVLFVMFIIASAACIEVICRRSDAKVTELNSWIDMQQDKLDALQFELDKARSQQKQCEEENALLKKQAERHRC